jgi:hypothetical protein
MQASNIISHIIFISEGTVYGKYEWPAGAEYCVVYKARAWPSEYSATSTSVRFFNDEATLDAWLDEMACWESEAGNSFACAVYEWDLGPNFRPGLSQAPYLLRGIHEANPDTHLVP